MKKKRLIYIIIFIILSIVIFVSLNYNRYNTKEYYKDKWNLTVSDCELIDSYSDQGWFGDGIKYEVYSINSIKDISLHLNKGRDTELEDKIMTLLEEKDVKKPSFTHQYQYYKESSNNDHLYIVYIGNQNELYILQEIE